MKRYTLRNALKKVGYEIKQWNNNYNERTAFIEKDGQLYYISTGDLRFRKHDNKQLLIRKAKYVGDWTGERNEWFLNEEIKEAGIEWYESEKKCDRNNW